MCSFLLIALNIEAVLAKRQFLLISKSFAVSIFQAAIFSFYMVKALPSNAESCEEQGDGKQNF